MDNKYNSTDIVNMLPLDVSNKEIATNIIEASDPDNIKNLTNLFNLNQAKKNVVRVMKLNGLLDKVQDQMIERFEKRPGEFSNTDLLNYMQVTQSAIDRANKSLNMVDNLPAITLNQVNINSAPELSKDSRDRVADAVKSILSKLNGNNAEIIDVEVGSLLKDENED